MFGLFFHLLLPSCIFAIPTPGFEDNRRAYYEHGKLNSPLIATFSPSTYNSRVYTREGKYYLNPERLQQGLSPEQYKQLHEYESDEKYQDSSVYKFKWIPGTEGGRNSQILNLPKKNSLGNKRYNRRYPLTPPFIKYRIGVIADLDKNTAKESLKAGEFPKTWGAVLKEGILAIQYDEANPQQSKVTIEWEKERIIHSGLNYAGRGMELSTFNVFNGHLYTCDDKTGVVYELRLGSSSQIEAIPWSILADGNFTGPEGFKCEWGAVKDEHLWIGGQGISVPDSRGNSSVLKNNQKFVKQISPTGEVTHTDWRNNFDKLAQILDIKFPGYVTHESAGWSDILEKWVFMPRRISKVKFSTDVDSKSGSNVVLVTDQNFENVQITRIGNLNPTHGFSSFKWVPGTEDQIIVALKTVENGNLTESYIMAFTTDGHIIFKETKFANQKFEGIEFI